MNISDFITDQKEVTETRYLVIVDFEDRPSKRKWFTRKDKIIGWVAKQYMLPIFDMYHARYHCERGSDEEDRCIWDDWAICKERFINRLKEDNLDKAILELQDYLGDWF